MHKSEIKVGGVYRAKINGNLTDVRVDHISEPNRFKANPSYHVTNLRTGRKTTFRSATKFRGIAPGYNADGTKVTTAAGAIARGEKFTGGSVMTAPQVKTVGDIPVSTADQMELIDQGGIAEEFTGGEKAALTEEVEYCTGEEPDCCEYGDPSEVCQACGKLNKPAEDDDSSDPTLSNPAATTQSAPTVTDSESTHPTSSLEEDKMFSPSINPSPLRAKRYGRPKNTYSCCSRPMGESHADDCPLFGLHILAPALEEVADKMTAETDEYGIRCPGCGRSEWNVRRHPTDPAQDQFECKLCNKKWVRYGDLGWARVADPIDTAQTLPTAPVIPLSSPEKTSGLGAALVKMTAPQPLDSSPHIIIIARAGTGKTTTLIEGLRLLRTGKTEMEPSPQQAVIWDQMIRGQQEGGPRHVCFVAFNTAIVDELKRRVPPRCDAMTMHSMGNRAVAKVLGRQEPKKYAVQDLIAKVMGTTVQNLRQWKPTVLKATEELVSLCKMNLVGLDVYGKGGSGADAQSTIDSALSQLARRHGVDLGNSRHEVFQLVPRVLEASKDPKGIIHFDDMIWLPIVLGLPIFEYDLLLVDEAQDLNRCQQALAMKAGKRLILCGDDKQAIYGFAGADSESLSRLQIELEQDGCRDGQVFAPSRGCIVLPLTVTRRCGKAIVKEAQQYVPDFEAFETNPEGLVSHAKYTEEKRYDGSGRYTLHTMPYEETYMPLVKDSDMVLCRTNAPLVRQYMKFIKNGRRASIRGKDVGTGLVKLMEAQLKKQNETIETANASVLIAAMSQWMAEELSKERSEVHPSEEKMSSITDRYDCIRAFTEDAMTATEVASKIQQVFTDDPSQPGIKLGSIHKAKGLEADRVWYLQPPDGGPRIDKMQDWELEQEDNLRYVATTRAKLELWYVS